MKAKTKITVLFMCLAAVLCLVLAITLTGCKKDSKSKVDDTFDTYKMSFTLYGNGKEYKVTRMTGDYYTCQIPSTYEGLPVTAIGDGAFADRESLTSVVIPDSVVTIGDEAFYYCTGLESVTIGKGVETIGEDAFRDCYVLKSVTIPDSVTTISDGAFRDCYELETLKLGEGVTSIGYEAFSAASLTSLTIPASVKTLSDRAFHYNTQLTSINFNATAMEDLSSGGNFVFSCAGQETSGVTVTIGANVTRIPAYLFDSYDGSFSDYSNNIKIVVFESGSRCTSIGEHAFATNCTALERVDIPSSVTEIGKDAFSACYALRGVYITDLAAWCGVSFDTGSANPLYFAKNLYLDGQLVTDLVIPSSVTEIGEYAFDFCYSLTSITIPSSVTTIGNDAFCGCTYVSTVYFNATAMNDLGKVSNYVFGNVGDSVSGTTVTIGANVTKIPAYLFSGTGATNYGSTNITTVVFEEGSKCASIGDYAFSGNISLTSINIPGSVKTIGSYAFYWCTSLPSLILPEGVTEIGDHAFFQCTSLTSIVIPSSVTEIGEYASYGMQLEVVYYCGTSTDWSEITIGDNNSWLTSATKYYYSEDNPTDSGNYWHYVDGEIVVWGDE